MLLSNGVLELRFDGKSGAIGELCHASTREQIIHGPSNELVYGTGSVMGCDFLAVREGCGSCEAVVEGRVLGERGALVAVFHSEIKLYEGEARIFFETTVHPVAIEPGDPWVNSVRARFRPALHPMNVNRMYLNVLERVCHERFVSLYAADLFSGESGPHLLLHNTGSQHYARFPGGIDTPLDRRQ